MSSSRLNHSNSQNPQSCSSPVDDVDGLAVRNLENVHETIDPRIAAALASISRPSLEKLDEKLEKTATAQLSDFVHWRQHRDVTPPDFSKELDVDLEKSKPTTLVGESESEPLYVEFEKNDKRNPVNFSNRKKWAITITAGMFTLLSATTSSSYNMGFPSMTRDLSCSDFQATIGLSVYALGFGVVPLVTASFSEEFGRQPLYIASSIGFMLMHLMVALAKNIQTVIIARFLSGAFGSTGATMVGGTIADIWRTHERGLPMSIFALCALGGTGLGPTVAGWVEANPRLQWRWIQWIHVIITGAYILLVLTVMQETRASILLTRLARRLRKETGDQRYRARVEDERTSLRVLIWVSCTRPLLLLLTEPIVLSFSVWIGLAWGLLYSMIESVGPIFKNLHGFNTGEEGTAYLFLLVGSLLGFSTNFYQEKLYQKNFPKRGPEARLYLACAAAVAFPVSMFIYAWTSFPQVHWIAPIIGITLFIWSAFILYLAVFTYMADCYGPFASSGLAGQSLARNVAGMAFPLFTTQMFARLTYHWASTLFALLSVFMVPIPFVLFFYGPKIRARSKFSSMVMQGEKSD